MQAKGWLARMERCVVKESWDQQDVCVTFLHSCYNIRARKSKLFKWFLSRASRLAFPSCLLDLWCVHPFFASTVMWKTLLLRRDDYGEIISDPKFIV